ncbi:MAG: amidohydrolase family protein [Clostridia bacterium]|nr:amidohydrolase family protein [Clostridia bacterium]MDE7328906.1 amidohydrolase family protein [Clostridia bacterium]
MVLTVTNAKIYTQGKFVQGNLTVDGGVITAIGNQVEGEVFDAKGKIAAAGFIDIHTHGGWGKDCMEANVDAIETICKYHLYTGTTTFVPTTMTASVEDINAAVGNIRKYKSNYAKIAGVHLEGPYLAQKSAGAHPPKLLITPEDCDSFVWENADIVKRITIAPNLKGAAKFCEKAVKAGIQVSMGHDDSIDDEIYACAENGANSVTHLYNCTSRPSRRSTPKKHLGLTEVGLIEDGIVAEVIADGRHVPDKLFGMIYKLKGSKGICLVSDSLSVAGMSDGDYFIGSGESKQRIRIDDSVAILPDLNTYAGSVTSVGKMVERLVKLGYSLAECVDMCTKTPARLLKRNDIGDIAVGMAGDINLLEEDGRIAATILGGEVVDKKSLEI